MGSRARAQIRTYSGRVDLYTHWGSESLGAAISDALGRGRGLWDDPEYLARIVFDSMKGGDTEGTTGFGIGPGIEGETASDVLRQTDCDCVYIIDCNAQKISRAGFINGMEPDEVETYSFGDFEFHNFEG